MVGKKHGEPLGKRGRQDDPGYLPDAGEEPDDVSDDGRSSQKRRGDGAGDSDDDVGREGDQASENGDGAQEKGRTTRLHHRTKSYPVVAMLADRDKDRAPLGLTRRTKAWHRPVSRRSSRTWSGTIQGPTRSGRPL